MTRYFAYGSNMGSAQMRQRCPDSRRLGKGWLEGYRWIIAEAGFASLLPSPSDSVAGIVWEISPADEIALDRFEDVHLDLYRKHHLPVRRGDETATALVYIDPVERLGQADADYIARINAALRDAELDPAYVEAHIRPFIPPLDPA